MIIKLANELEKEANFFTKNWNRMKDVKTNKGILSRVEKGLKAQEKSLNAAELGMSARINRLEEAASELEKAQHGRKTAIQGYLNYVRSPLEAVRKGNVPLEEVNKDGIKTLHKKIIEDSRDWQKAIQKHDANVAEKKKEVEKYKGVLEETKKRFVEDEKYRDHWKREVKIGENLRIGAGAGTLIALGGAMSASERALQRAAENAH